MFEHIDFKSGIVQYDDINIDPKKPFKEQIFSFKQDLFQVSYCHGKYVIDIGWHPEFNKNGEFVLVVIKDFNWDNPIFEQCTKDLMTLEGSLQEAIEFVRICLKKDSIKKYI